MYITLYVLISAANCHSPSSIRTFSFSSLSLSTSLRLIFFTFHLPLFIDLVTLLSSPLSSLPSSFVYTFQYANAAFGVHYVSCTSPRPSCYLSTPLIPRLDPLPLTNLMLFKYRRFQMCVLCCSSSVFFNTACLVGTRLLVRTSQLDTLIVRPP
jgi:hypothetical protein